MSKEIVVPPVSVSLQATYQSEPPPKEITREAGFAPQVLVRTIEQTRQDLAWHAEEQQRKKERKEAAAKLTANQNVASKLQYAENRHAPSIEYTDEQLKYQRMWAHEQYRGVAPGEDCASVFMNIVRPKAGAQIIDFGTGTGRGALMLAVLTNGKNKIHMLDFANNSLDEDVRNALTTQAHCLEFTQHDLTKASPMSAPLGYCTDVLEHIPPEQVDLVLLNILQAAQHVFFQISCTDDSCGVLIGEKLHLSVHPYAWWLKKLQSLDAIIHWSEDCGTHCMFYCTAWMDGKDLAEHGKLNIEEQSILENVKANLANNWNEVMPHETNDMEVMILCGGPSLNDHVDAIKALRASGVKLITLNGTYNWSIERGLTPSAQIMVDAREFNARFTKPVVDGCKYLISSQCHPSVFENLPKDRTYLWHTTMDSIRETVNAARELWWGVPGGSTIMLRAIPLLRMLGFKRFHVFGWDSCLVRSPDESQIEANQALAHHAYSQPENDNSPAIAVIVGDRTFQCHPWMISQAQELSALIKFLGNEIELEVYGDGLIAHILKTGAKMAEDEAGKRIELI
jgi:hypothetical protein